MASFPSFSCAVFRFVTPLAALALPGAPARAELEDASARAALPLYQTIPAAPTTELTPANGLPDPRP